MDADEAEYRPLTAEDDAAYRDAVNYAFRPTDPDPDEEPFSLGERRGMVVDGEVRSVCRHVFFTASVRGDWHALAGLSGVATPPEHRRQGLVAEMLGASLREYRDREVEFSALWPFDRDFYGRYGWATASTAATLSCPPSALPRSLAPGDEVDHRARRVEADAWERLDRVHSVHADRYGLSLDRREAWWRERVFETWDGPARVVALTREDAPVAYCSYTVEDDDGRHLQVREAAWTDRSALGGLCRYLGDHDSQVERVRLPGAEGGDLRFLLDRVDGEAEYDLSRGPMVRVVDVPTALESLPYPEGVTADLTLGVTDPVLDANDGSFRLSVADGRADVERTDADPSTTLDVGTLSQAVVGYRPVGDLPVEAEETVCDRLAAVFPSRDLYLREFF
jgi:predicted acetyltransferase